MQYPFPKPLPRISSPYGWRTHPISKRRRKHNGTDFAAKSGTPIHAIADGVVVKSKKSGHPTGGYGQFIQIDHGNGVHSLYAHMLTGSRKVSVGDKVVEGQHIGNVGSTGYSTGPHLHFEIRVKGSFVDPMKFIAKQKIADKVAETKTATPDNNVIEHTIVRGDTLWGLSRKYNTSVSKIMKLNGLRGSLIIVGRKLKITPNTK